MRSWKAPLHWRQSNNKEGELKADDSDRKVVESVCAAMQTGADGLEDLLELFAENGVLIEPFSGQAVAHQGKPAIQSRCAEMLGQPRPPDFRLTLDRVDREGDQVVTAWTCTAPVMPAPLHGTDHYTIRDGKIERLEITINSMPEQM